MIPSTKPSAPFHELERGRVRFYVRPRVGLADVASFSDVQRFFFTLLPNGRGPARRVGVGRKRMPDPHVRERLWAFVDRVGSPALLLEDVGDRAYETKTRGVRHQAAAIEIARGSYAIAQHRDHAHLSYELDDEESNLLLRGLRLEARGDCIATVFNPEAKWRIRDHDEPATPFREPSIYDDALMERFGTKRFAALEPAFLDHEGAELVLLGGGSATLSERSGNTHRTLSEDGL